MEMRLLTTQPQWWYPYAITVPIGLLMFVWIALSESPSELKVEKPAIQQSSQGSNSPNIVGDHNVVIISPDNEEAAKLIAKLLHDKDNSGQVQQPTPKQTSLISRNLKA